MDAELVKRLLEPTDPEPEAEIIAVEAIIREAAMDPEATRLLVAQLEQVITTSNATCNDALLALSLLLGAVIEERFGSAVEYEPAVLAITREFSEAIDRHSRSYGAACNALSAKMLSLLRGMAIVRARAAANAREGAV